MLRLHYSKPATHFNEALPLGNGRQGLVVYGGIFEELIRINDDTLWSGGLQNYTLPKSRELLPEIRKLILAGKYRKGSELTRELQGPNCEAYVPAGDLCIQFGVRQDVREYKRWLDLTDAVARVRYQLPGGWVTREHFVSYPAGVSVSRLASEGNPLNLSIRLQSPHPYTITSTDSGYLCLSGYAPYHVKPDFYTVDKDGRPFTPEESVAYDPQRGMRFAIYAAVRADGGDVAFKDGSLVVSDSRVVELFIATGTSFNGWDKDPVTEGIDPAILPETNIGAALNRTYEDLKTEHITDYAALFNRFSIRLGDVPVSSADTDDQLKAFQHTKDPNLIALLCQYGRYLMIAGSRPGTQAMNLQGIWNDQVRPPWSCNYTTNINLEMNYWPAEITNLAECHEPLIDMVTELSRAGQAVAKVNYGARGWVTDHNTDIWRITCPVGDYGMGDPKCSIWPMAGAWLSNHLFEHYEYGLDTRYLRETAYPILRSAAEFFLDYLVEDDRGQMVTVPSTSPENTFKYEPGKEAGVSLATTMDMSLLRELFGNCITACDILDIDAEFKAELEAARAKLRPAAIGRHGQITEWAKDWDDPDDKHRHVSHLYGLYPGREFTAEETPELFAAARKSLELRGDEATGWSFGWKINLWARLKDGTRAYSIIKTMLRYVQNEQPECITGGGLYGNLFGAHPPFQIDGNFGVCAGIVEMLVQKTGNSVVLLPALPEQWDQGEIRGVRLRGGIGISFAWSNHQITTCELRVLRQTELTLHVNGTSREVNCNPESPTLLTFDAQ